MTNEETPPKYVPSETLYPDVECASPLCEETIPRANEKYCSVQCSSRDRQIVGELDR